MPQCRFQSCSSVAQDDALGRDFLLFKMRLLWLREDLSVVGAMSLDPNHSRSSSSEEHFVWQGSLTAHHAQGRNQCEALLGGQCLICAPLYRPRSLRQDWRFGIPPKEGLETILLVMVLAVLWQPEGPGVVRWRIKSIPSRGNHP